MERLRLGQYGDRFEADDIDLDVLPSLSEQDLEKLGVSMGHRKRLLKAIAELGGGASTPVAPDATAAPYTPTRPDRPEARKVVTILFADLAGSTALHERLDPESVRRFMEGYYRTMRGAVEAHGGTVVKLMGDGVMAAFGVPRVAEEDALSAVRAGVAMQAGFRELARQEFAAVGAISLRVGINTGEVVVGADNSDVVGDPVNVAARLQAEAHDGEVVIGESTRRLVAARVTLAPLGSFALKGRTEAMKAYCVESLDPVVGTSAAAFVGRDDELTRLLAVYEAALAKPAARLVVLLGSPGLGKSRLVEEMTLRLGDAASIVTAHCDAAAGATFAPLAAALRELFQIEAGASPQAVEATIETAIPAADAERRRIAGGIAALLADSPASPEETFFVIRRLLAALADAKPVVLVIDDLHWAEPLLLDLVEHLVQWGSGTRLLVLVGARPELRDLRSSLVTPGGLVSDVLTLSGLDAGAAMRLAANVIGAADLPAAVAAKVLATSEGNPLFVGELVRMLVDEGAIERRGERWVVGANLAALEMPPTIHALLAARIERLGLEDRAVLERAAVVGRHFSRSAVAALLGRNGSELDARLESLRRTELIERDGGWFLGEPVLRFHHVLIRDAAYRRLLKGTRAELHERLADWIEAQVGDAPEHDETIGWHLEQAHQHRRELGPLDAQGRALGERAARRLAVAGRRALARDDVPVAAGLLGRALERLDADDPARAELALDWCEALLAGGDVGTAATAIGELGRFVGGAASGPAPRLAAWHTCFTGQLIVLTAPQALHTTADAVAAAAGTLASLEDAAGEAKGHFVHALVLARLGRIGGCETALDKALAAARRAGDRRRANTVLAIAPLAALWGPSPVTRASGRCLDVVRVLRITQGAPAVEAVALSCQAVLEALRGRTEAARRMIASARKMVEDLGITQRLLETDVFGGLIDLLEGDAVAAERSLRGAYHGLRELGLGIDAARAAALVARALLAQDRGAEAEALSCESEALAGDDLKAAIAWRGVRAEALARRGEPAAAVEFARQAVEIAAATDALLDHADARLALAASLRAAGRGGDADAEERRAMELWEAKGALLLVQRTSRAAATVAAPTAAPLARFDAVTGDARHAAAERSRVSRPAVARRVSPNAASAWRTRFEAALAARDFAAVAAGIHEDYWEIDHPTGSTFGGAGAVASIERLFRSRAPYYEGEQLATLGDRLLLATRRTGASGDTRGRYDVGAYENEAIQVTEVDVHGLNCRQETFAAGRLGDALVRLYDRYAELLPQGPARTRAAGIARSLAAFDGRIDLDRMRAAYGPSFRNIDHRVLGTWSVADAEEMLRHFRLQLDLAPDLAARYDDVLAADTHAAVTRMTFFGTARDSGGRFENHLSVVFRFGADGRVTCIELFEPEQVAEALGRFDEGYPPGIDAAANWFENAAARTDRALLARFNARDWAGVEALAAPGLLIEERRRMPLDTSGRDVGLARLRALYGVPARRVTTTLLGTRGERLSLSLQRSSGEVAGDGGPPEMEHLVLHEVDADGRLVAIVLFDVEDDAAAWGALDARFDAGEGVALGGVFTRYAATANSRDWAALTRLCAPTLVEHDHRHITGIGTTHGRDTWVQSNVRVWFDLVPDIRGRMSHLRGCARGILWQLSLSGSREGGRFEITFAGVTELDERGAFQRIDVYDLDQLDEARARFAELARPAGVPVHVANAATATVATMLARTVTRERADGRAMRARSEILATRGDRLALHRVTFEVTEGAVESTETTFLMLTEVDEGGRVVAHVCWELDDVGTAYTEIDARWEAGDGAGWARLWWAREVFPAIDRRDWEAAAACVAPEFVGHDHRLVGVGEMSGPQALIRPPREMVAIAPDARMRVDHVRACDRGAIMDIVWLGTQDGGAFESQFIIVVEVGSDGRALRADFYDPQHLDDALARFAELPGETGSASVTDRRAAIAKPTAAIAAMKRYRRDVDAQDWDAVRAACSSRFTWDDRRAIVGMSGDVELLIASARAVQATGTHLERREVIGTAGDRVAISRLLWAGGPADGRSEVEYLAVFEVDADGLYVANVLFDADELRPAQREAWARWAAIDPTVSELTAHLNDMIDAWNAEDRDRLRACFAENLVVDDRRWTGVGRCESRDEYLRSVAALWALAPQSRFEAGWFWLAYGPHGGVYTCRRSGTLPDGGEFVSEFLGLTLLQGGLATRCEAFEMDAAGSALARFDELRPDLGHAASSATLYLNPAASNSAWMARRTKTDSG